MMIRNDAAETKVKVCRGEVETDIIPVPAWAMKPETPPSDPDNGALPGQTPHVKIGGWIIPIDRLNPTVYAKHV